MKRSFSIFLTLFGVALATLVTVGCKRTSYSIEATVMDGLNGETAYLFDALTEETIDSVVVADGKAIFSGKTDSTRIVALVGVSYAPVVFFLEPGKIKIDADSNCITGTKLNNDYTEFINDKNLQALSQKCEEIRSEIYTVEDEGAQVGILERYEAASENLQKALKTRCLELYDNHKKDLLGAYALTIVSQNLTYAELDSLLSDAAPVVANFAPLAEIYQSLKSVEESQPGHSFIDFNGTDYATGKPASLASMIDGKIAVVDFWASWCRPCREEITSTLIPLYEEFKSKGVEVIGVDVSDTAEDHDKAVKELGITYPQLIDSEKKAGNLYGLKSIPQILIIDRNGTIVARDLRGDDIRVELEKLLAE